MNPANELKTWQQKAQAQTELLLAHFLPSESQVPHTLHEAMRYVTLGGGKRLRPLLVLAASELGEANQNAVEQAMAAIAANRPAMCNTMKPPPFWLAMRCKPKPLMY